MRRLKRFLGRLLCCSIGIHLDTVDDSGYGVLGYRCLDCGRFSVLGFIGRLSNRKVRS